VGVVYGDGTRQFDTREEIDALVSALGKVHSIFRRPYARV
jgi:hypothetical protein